MIVTHNGPFHCDDVFAVAILKSVSGFEKLPVVRTRDRKLIETADVVVDVGDLYEPVFYRFDHHQFRTHEAKVRSRFMPAVALSSAGMVWEAFAPMKWGERVSAIVYRELIADIDLQDNGWAPPVPAGYPNSGSLSAVISRMNPAWNDEKEFDARFEEAWTLANGILKSAIHAAKAQVEAEKIVMNAPRDGRVLVLDRSIPDARDMAIDLDVDLIVHPSDYGGWMIMTVPPSRENVFSQRVPFPLAWRGLRGDALNALLKEAGVPVSVLASGTSACPSAVFAHNERFCGGHGTLDAAMAMTRIILTAAG